MANGNFSPKLMSARPRVSAALQAASVRPFGKDITPPPMPKPPKDPNARPPKQQSAIAIALRRAF